MTKRWMLIPLGLAALALVAGCGQQDADTAGSGDAADAPSEAGELVAQAEDAADAASSRMREAVAVAGETVFTGTLGCGHCTYHVGEECAPAIQTADGTIYVVEAETGQEELMADRFSGKELTLAGTVEERNGLHVLHVAKVDLP